MSEVIDRGDDIPVAEEVKKPEAAPETKAPEAKSEAPEVEVEAEAEAEAEVETEPESKKTPQRIPLARHKEILERERATRAELERQLAQYQNGQDIANINAELTKNEERLVEMEATYAKLMSDGETDKAATKMTEIRRLEREIIERKSDMKIAAAEARATEQARYNIALERIESAYPTLNPDHESYDQELTDDVSDLKDTYQRRGLTPTEALQRAVKRLAKPASARQAEATEVSPRVSAKDVAAERKKEAVSKTIDAVQRTPASMKNAGVDSDKMGGSISGKDVMKMSWKDFTALSDEALSQMRGDDV